MITEVIGDITEFSGDIYLFLYYVIWLIGFGYLDLIYHYKSHQ